MAVRLKPEQVDQLRRKAERYISQRSTPDIAASNKLQLAHLDEKEERLTDALIDKLIDGETYHKRKERIEAERLDLERSMEEEASVPDYRASVAKFLELAESLYLHYQMADKVQKRQIALNAFSNRTANGKNLFLEPRKWLKEPDKTIDVLCGPPHQDRTRTIEMIETLLEVSTEKTTPPQE